MKDIHIGVNLCWHCGKEMRRYEFIYGMRPAMRYICDDCNCCYPVFYENPEGIFLDWEGRRRLI